MASQDTIGDARKCEVFTFSWAMAKASTIGYIYTWNVKDKELLTRLRLP